MYCDYDALEQYSNTLNSTFNEIIDIMNDIEESYKTISNTSNWQSLTSTYFRDATKNITSNIDIINNKFYNVKQYLDTVVDNYHNTEDSLSNLFSTSFLGF